MCSIYGALGPTVNDAILDAIRDQARDRGRDGGRMERYVSLNGWSVMLGNWRATPTPEPMIGDLQPYDQMVHNGTIANDLEIGAKPDEIDSQALARFINRESVSKLARSLQDVKGSYALACFNGRSVLAATNYKPLYYFELRGSIYFSSMARHFEGVARFGHAPVQLKPYTAIDFLTGEVVSLKREDSKSAVVIASSGLDSTVAATRLVRDGWNVCLLHFTYGCAAEVREREAIHQIAKKLKCQAAFMPVDLKAMLGRASSTLFGSEDAITPAIQGAEFAHEWVPGRNLVFISLATAWAEANGWHAVALGNNLEEAGAYPDNEEQFTTLLNDAMPYAVRAHYAMRLLSPVGHLMKHEIVKLGLQISAPFESTWSCYRGGTGHCGKCGPCFMRRKAFERNGEQDPVFSHDSLEA